MSDTLPADDWTALLGRYAEHLRGEDKRPLTVRNYLRELRAFAAWHRDAYREPPSILELQAEDLRDYRDALRARKLKPQSINLARAALASLIRWAHSERIIREPIRSPRAARQMQRVPRWLTKPQERRLLKVIRKSGNDRHLGLVELMLVFGLRIAEAAGLTWRDVAMGRSRAELRVFGKGAKERVLPFLGNERARKALILLGSKERAGDKAAKLLRGQRGGLTSSGIRQLLTAYGQAAGLEHFSPHVLRHTCARRMFERGEQPQVIARWMGHESLNTTFLYTLPSEEDMARAAGTSAEGWGEAWGDGDG